MSDLANSSPSAGSFRSWPPVVFPITGEVFQRPSDVDEVDLKWAALEKLPTYDRMRKGILMKDGVCNEVDICNLGTSERKLLVENILKEVEKDNERFLRRLKSRIDQVGLELPKVEVRFEGLSVEADTYVGSRALPTLFNSTLNILEGAFGLVGLSPSKKKVNKILKSVSGILKPSRMTLLLGPPASGKTTLLLALAGKLDKRLRESGKVTYCGHEFSEFYPERTCAYISEQDVHIPEMTVRETLDFSGRCLGVGVRYEMLSELSRREKESHIQPDPEIDTFMKATAMEGQKHSLATDYILKVLGLDICADIIVGDEMRRGISGGQKKRVTTGEMLVGPARALFMDEISTGLDCSTTFQIVKFLRQMVHIMDGTVLISLLQPAPETFELFDDILLLSEGEIVYYGPRENVLEFFEFMGFRCPERKGVADFLQEVTSKNDQEHYWFNANEPYHYIPVSEFARFFQSFHIGRQLLEDVKQPYNKSITHPAALTKQKYGMPPYELFKACLSSEWLQMKRNSFLYIFKTTQITIMSLICMSVFLRIKMSHDTIADGDKYMGALFYGLMTVMFNGFAEMAMTVYRLPVFYKQRDLLFFPPWAFGLSFCIPKILVSLLESGIWIIITYYTVGFAPAASRFFKQLLAFFSIHQMSLALFRFIGAAGRTMILSSTYGNFIWLIIFVLGGFVISKDYLKSWWAWACWTSPMMYGQNAIAINEFLDPRWNTPNNDTKIDAPTIGIAILKSRGMFVDDYWYWISIGALIAFSLLYNSCFILALTYLNPVGNSQAALVNEDVEVNDKSKSSSNEKSRSQQECRSGASGKAKFANDNNMASHVKINDVDMDNNAPSTPKRGMVLPFQPLSLAFHHVNFFVNMPAEMKSHGATENRLQLLCDVSGAFRPGCLTALVGETGAGKTTLMDVLAGRKTRGYTEGSITVSGYPKNQETFARVCGYCEQTDIHSPNVTVYESLVYSAWLRLPADIDQETIKMFVEEVMELVELRVLRDALVGLPGLDGLTTEQRKRLTIAVELVANPSIIFMDEPTSGLDARAAAIVMRAVRNTVNTGRTVVCTIHQPGIDIFESFDELLLMKRGGQVIYAGALGQHSHNLIEYFENIPGIPKISEGCNPATWMLDVSSPSMELRLGVNFAEIYSKSSLYQENDDLIKELGVPANCSNDLYFPSKYSQSFFIQCISCFWKQNWSYWRNPQYNSVRFFTTIVYGLLFGTLFWNMGEKSTTQQDLLNILGAIYSSVFFFGVTSCISVQPVVAIERTVFYRERAAGMYSSLSYAFAQVSIEVIYIAMQSILYVLILFPMIGFSWQAENFLWFLYFIFMCGIYFTLYGMMVIALTPNYQTASIILSFIVGLWNLFAGFIIPRLQLPIWWRWFYWVNPLAWTIQGIVISQLGERDNLVEIPGQKSMQVNDYLKEKLGFDHSYFGYAVAVHVGFVLVFVFVFAYSIKYLNFQNK